MIVSFFLVLLIIGYIIYKVDEYLSFNKKYNSPSYSHTVKLKWDMIYNLYRVNPDRWRYEFIDYYGPKSLLYNSGDTWKKKPHSDEYRNGDKIVRIKLSFIDFLKFSWYVKHPPNDSAGMELITASAQKDIELLKEEANKKIREANESINKIKESLGDEESTVLRF